MVFPRILCSASLTRSLITAVHFSHQQRILQRGRSGLQIARLPSIKIQVDANIERNRAPPSQREHVQRSTLDPQLVASHSISSFLEWKTAKLIISSSLTYLHIINSSGLSRSVQACLDLSWPDLTWPRFRFKQVTNEKRPILANQEPPIFNSNAGLLQGLFQVRANELLKGYSVIQTVSMRLKEPRKT